MSESEVKEQSSMVASMEQTTKPEYFDFLSFNDKGSKLFNYCDMNDRHIYTIPTMEEFDEIYDTFQDFMAEHREELDKAKSFLATPIKFNGDLVIMVGASRHLFDLDLPELYRNYSIHIKEDCVALCGKGAGKMELSSIKQNQAELQVGSEIGPGCAKSRTHFCGPLGGFFEVQPKLADPTSASSLLYGLTSFHVVDEMCEHFYQPWYNNRMSRREREDSGNMNQLIASRNTDYGECGFVNNRPGQVIDYKLVECTRKVKQPFNAVKLKDSSETQLLPMKYDLNGKKVARAYFGAGITKKVANRGIFLNYYILFLVFFVNRNYFLPI